MSTSCDINGLPIYVNEVDIREHEAYGDVVGDVFRDAAGCFVSGRVEDDDELNLGSILLSRNDDVRTSLLVDFMAIWIQSRQLSFVDPERVGNVFGMALWGLDALQEL